jgi:excisionase family DNA binding protein
VAYSTCLDIPLVKQVFSTGEAAKLCNVSLQTIIRCFDSGKLKGFHVPGSRFRRIPRDELVRFMRENGIPTEALEKNRTTVLIVEDDVDLAGLVRDELARDGRFEVAVAETGFDAGLMVKELHPDVVVLDLMLPDIHGKHVCQRIRQDATLAKVRIICTSGDASADEIVALKAAGADDFLPKPFTVDVLLARICDVAGLAPSADGRRGGSAPHFGDAGRRASR